MREFKRVAKNQANKAIAVFTLMKIRFVLRKVPPLENVILITAADESHFRSLVQLLNSIFEKIPNQKVIVYDLGLSRFQISAFKKEFPLLVLKLFDYSAHPSFFDIKKDAGAYAWKPAIIKTVIDQYRMSVIWMDAGNVVHGNLEFEKKYMQEYGLFTTVSSGTIERWTHPKTISYMHAADVMKLRELNGACIGFSVLSPMAMAILNRWTELSKIEECISPVGSNRENHRQDQAIFSILVQQEKRLRHLYSKFDSLNTPTRTLSYDIHRDID